MSMHFSNGTASLNDSLGSEQKITLKKTDSKSKPSRFANKASKSNESSEDNEEYNPYGDGNTAPKTQISRFKSMTKGAEIDFPSRKGSVMGLDIAPGLTLQDVDGDEEDLCMICYTNKINSVVLPCGHGNVCLDCNHKFISESGKCCICRADVTQMLKVDPSNLRNDCLKVLSAYFYVSNKSDGSESDGIQESGPNSIGI